MVVIDFPSCDQKLTQTSKKGQSLFLFMTPGSLSNEKRRTYSKSLISIVCHVPLLREGEAERGAVPREGDEERRKDVGDVSPPIGVGKINDKKRIAPYTFSSILKKVLEIREENAS